MNNFNLMSNPSSVIEFKGDYQNFHSSSKITNSDL